MIGIAIVLTFISVTAFSYFIMQNWQAKSGQIKTRLDKLKPAGTVSYYNQLDINLEKPLVIRVFCSGIKSVGRNCSPFYS